MSYCLPYLLVIAGAKRLQSRVIGRCLFGPRGLRGGACYKTKGHMTWMEQTAGTNISCCRYKQPAYLSCSSSRWRPRPRDPCHSCAGSWLSHLPALQHATHTITIGLKWLITAVT
jgi:hypothetical protein